MKKISTFIILALFILNGYGQTSCNQRIVFKVKSEFRNYCSNEKISIPNFQLLAGACNLGNIHKIFPKIDPPTTMTNKSGDTLVDLSLIYQADIETLSIPQICRTMKSSGWFEYVEPKNTHQLMFTPNDPYLASQYYLNNIRAYSGWDICRGDSSIVVGISDTGFDFSHSDLAGSIATNPNDPIDGIDNDNDGYIDNYQGWDLGMNDNNVQYETKDHGAFVSGIVAARANNGIGIAGVGYNTKILPLKITNTSEVLTSGYESMVYGATHGCSVINCSWGGPITDGKYGEDIINFVTYNCNVLVVAACGNDNAELPLWPATYRNVLSVGSVDAYDQKTTGTHGSTYGWDVDLMAPGLNIYSTIGGSNSYGASSGTSFAAPMVSACAAILKSYFTLLTPIQIAQRLRVTTDYIDTIAANVPYAGKLGKGRLNLFRALTDLDCPAVRYQQPHFSTNAPSTGDTVAFYATFKNYLLPTHELKISISSAEGNIIPIDTLLQPSSIGTMDTYTNLSVPFRFIIGNNGDNSAITLKITYTDTNYTDFEYISFYVNQQYLSVDTNHIATTFTGNSRLGFADNYYHQGNGFNYLDYNQMFYMGGLMIGKNTDCVSDNLYGETNIDHDFTNMIAPVRIIPSAIADYEAYTQYNDNGAGNNGMNLQVSHRIYAWDQPECEDFVVHSFTVKNNGATPQTGLYIGMYVDWDIYLSMYNKAKYDPETKTIYAWSPYGGKFGGISALSPLPVNKYAFDNDGSALSLKISDGFDGIEKFTALTSNRDSAGYNNMGGDVSTLLDYPQIDLLPGDSITLNFALVAGNTPYDLANAANAATDKINHIPDRISNFPTPTASVIAYPNPASESLRISAPDQIMEIELIGMMGETQRLPIFKQSEKDLRIDVSKFPSGIYILNIITSNSEYSKKIIINH